MMCCSSFIDIFVHTKQRQKHLIKISHHTISVVKSNQVVRSVGFVGMPQRWRRKSSSAQPNEQWNQSESRHNSPRKWWLPFENCCKRKTFGCWSIIKNPWLYEIFSFIYCCVFFWSFFSPQAWDSIVNYYRYYKIWKLSYFYNVHNNTKQKKKSSWMSKLWGLLNMSIFKALPQIG